MSEGKFVGFPKIPRYSRECIVTEKLDGANCQIVIDEDGTMRVGSKNRYITPDNDHHGFATWAQDNIVELLKLGPGRHFGEWWGFRINRGYGLKEKRFSLFNIKRWGDLLVRPNCCFVVPIIDQGMFTTEMVGRALDFLRRNGSLASPGFMQPEGIVIFHVQGNLMFKKTILRDEVPKGKAE